ncbi:hypothetical protein RPB_3483 [Rhodopseudomonas palustris HaA2]|uniref:Uncharacterized protein n=1 Tax=Rhodopseudomonas palustris (strain HaA2) TaxID=316058 RepID=Q2IUD2_RHOP2|nr:hypothetical protein [Rhodopseudomonas palustris]ABD08178.1 hypothetical protein RPB_3483 [Rhodopseudomonas palustris HaA2]
MWSSSASTAAHQRARFMQPDAARWMRPDADRWIRPDVARFLAPGVRPQDVFPALDRKYNPNQPRVPKGNPDGGEWTLGGLGARWSIDLTGVSPEDSGNPPDRVRLAQVGSSIADIFGLPYYEPGGHHEMVKAVYTKWDLQPETRKVFEKSTTGKLPSGKWVESPEGRLLRGHVWDEYHAKYNEAVRELSERFLEEKKITPKMMTPRQAEELCARIRLSEVPEIRDDNRAIRLLRQVFRLRFGRE